MRTIKQTRTATSQLSAQYVVLENGEEIGLIEKYRDNKSETHPWKAFRGIGMGCQFIGSFYPEEGGKKAAINSI